MRKILWMAAAGVLLVGACSKSKDGSPPETNSTDPTAGDLKTKAAASDKVAGENSDTAKPDESAGTKCQIDGHYRIRFDSNGTKGWWFRVQVEGDKASLLEPVSMLSLEPGPLVLKRVDETCELQLRARAKAVNEVLLDVKIDPQTNQLSGTMTRTKNTDPAEKTTAIAGRWDAKAPASPLACFVPGVYKLAFDKKAKWANEFKDDTDSCDGISEMASPVVFRLEPFGKTIAITAHENYDPFDEAWPGATLELKDPCEIGITMEVGEELTLEATLTLSAKGISGTALNANYQMIEDGTAGENIWNCIGKDVGLSGTRM